MSTQVTVVGDLLVVVEGDLGPPLPSSVNLEKDDVPRGSVEEAAIYGAWIVRAKPFPKDNREIAREVMQQMLEEGGHSWSDSDEDAAVIEKMLAALEAETISEAEFVDWVCLRVATA